MSDTRHFFIYLKLFGQIFGPVFKYPNTNRGVKTRIPNIILYWDNLNTEYWLLLFGLTIQKVFEYQRGCRLEIIVDQYPCKSDLEPFFWKCFNADQFYFYADWRISNNIFHFITFEESKTTCPFNGNEASRMSYLIGLLTKLPEDHIPLL